MKKIALTLSLLLLLCLTSTHAQAQCCTYPLSMHDSDAWDGAFLQVLISNVSVGTYTATGFGTAVTFQVCNGDSLELMYTAGQYENEHTYELQDSSWNIVFQDGPMNA